MDPLIVASASIAILREAMAEIQAAVQRGEISVDAQEVQLRKIDMLRVGQFVGPEWTVTPDVRPQAPSDSPTMPGPHTVSDPTKPAL